MHVVASSTRTASAGSKLKRSCLSGAPGDVANTILGLVCTRNAHDSRAIAAPAASAMNDSSAITGTGGHGSLPDSIGIDTLGIGGS